MTELMLIVLITLFFICFFFIFAATNEAYYAKPGHRIEAVLDFFYKLMNSEWR